MNENKIDLFDNTDNINNENELFNLVVFDVGALYITSLQ